MAYKSEKSRGSFMGSRWPKKRGSAFFGAAAMTVRNAVRGVSVWRLAKMILLECGKTSELTQAGKSFIEKHIIALVA
jgi:hypothetical protein